MHWGSVILGSFLLWLILTVWMQVTFLILFVPLKDWAWVIGTLFTRGCRRNSSACSRAR